MWASRPGLGQNAPMADQATETMEIAASKAPAFKPAAAFKNAVNG